MAPPPYVIGGKVTTTTRRLEEQTAAVDQNLAAALSVMNPAEMSQAIDVFRVSCGWQKKDISDLFKKLANVCWNVKRANIRPLKDSIEG